MQKWQGSKTSLAAQLCFLIVFELQHSCIMVGPKVSPREGARPDHSTACHQGSQCQDPVDGMAMAGTLSENLLRQRCAFLLQGGIGGMHLLMLSSWIPSRGKNFLPGDVGLHVLTYNRCRTIRRRRSYTPLHGHTNP